MVESRFLIVEQLNVIELQWNSIQMDRDAKTFYRDFEKSLPGSPNNLIYVFEGKHQAYPTRTVLYIGKTESRTNDKRPRDYAKARIYGKPERMASTYSEMILRWSIIPEISGDDVNKWEKPESLTPTKIIEHMLVHAMKPVLNNHGADGYMQEMRCEGKLQKVPCTGKLLVCNKGDKGLLLPVIYGDYYDCKEKWE